MEQTLVIKYVHKCVRNGDYAMNAGNLAETIFVAEVDKQYPSRWMKKIFENNRKSLLEIGICREVVEWDYKFMTMHICNPSSIGPLDDVSGDITFKFSDENITDESVYSLCFHCAVATELHFDNIYNNMLNNIRMSIYELMLCLKYLKIANIPRDIISLIGKIAWNTRYDIEWAKLDSNGVETIVGKSIETDGDN